MAAVTMAARIARKIEKKGKFSTNARCTHHDHEESHSCGAHACHADKGGCTGSCH